MMWLHFIYIMVVWRKRNIKEMVVWNGNENENTPKRAKMKIKEKWERELIKETPTQPTDNVIYQKGKPLSIFVMWKIKAGRKSHLPILCNIPFSV